MRDTHLIFFFFFLSFIPIAYLIPCPGPHASLSIHKWEVPGPIEMQSSPVRMFELRMVTFDDLSTWMPSVLGLLLAAKTFTPWIFTSWQSYTTMWYIWLLTEDNPLINIFCESETSNVWKLENKQNNIDYY